ncbi:hypothetical protein I4F81_002949 [Pyropia yezoensis]|uniref:Uncharacterized protein n=1 Tax=Pyropia yezoensis TaxID=2788 RepID=A0ACC3BRK1_PYRYE|nr:hypothetical protein I4F81_002949 [Neopyropia yezoensis]|eukprot:contig_27092_g6673
MALPGFVSSVSVSSALRVGAAARTARLSSSFALSTAVRPAAASATRCHVPSAPLRMTSTASPSAESATAAPLVDLRGKKALVTGIANNRSIAWGVAQQLSAAGADVGVAYLPLSDKVTAKVKSLTEELSPSLFVPCDVTKPEDMAALADTIKSEWGGVDVIIHCLAFANREDLAGDFSATSAAGFSTALNISAFSLVEMCGTLKPLMNEGASVVTLSYLGATKVVPNYNVMGVAKAALEASVRYLASELGPQGVRVNAISAGPIRTLASSAIAGFVGMLKQIEAVAPLRRTVKQKEVGTTAAFLASDASSGITGQVIFVDCGYEIMGAPPKVE